MSRLLDFIKAVKQSGQAVSVYVPGTGFVDAVVSTIDDDMITIVPDTGTTKVTMHYTTFCVQTNK